MISDGGDEAQAIVLLHLVDRCIRYALAEDPAPGFALDPDERRALRQFRAQVVARALELHAPN